MTNSEAGSDCQRAGIAKAKAAGRYKGRAPTARAKKAEVLALKAGGIGPSEIARRLGIGRSSVYRVLGAAQAVSSIDEW